MHKAVIDFHGAPITLESAFYNFARARVRSRTARCDTRSLQSKKIFTMASYDCSVLLSTN